MFGLRLLVSIAFAGEADLELERGRVAFELEQYQAARDRAIASLQAEAGLDGAHQLYVDATTAAGLGSRGLYELVDLEVTERPWHAAVTRLKEAIQDDDWKAIRATTETLLVTWPDAPDLLAPLWGDTSAKVVGLRGRLLSALVDPAAISASSAEKLYRLRRLQMEVNAPEGRDIVERALVDIGEDKPPPRPPLARLERGEVALQLAKDPVPAVPWGYPSETVDVIGRLDALWTKAGRYRHVALAWQQGQRVTDDSAAWTQEANAWLLADEGEKAAVAVNSAMSRATRPRNVDLVALNADRQRADLAAVFLARARLNEKTGDIAGALADLGTACLLAGRVLDDKLGERLDKLSATLATSVAAKYPSTKGMVAEGAVVQASVAMNNEVASQKASDARFLSTVGTRGGKLIAEAPEAYVDLFARSFMAEAEAEKRAGRVDQARTAAVIATMLTGPQNPWWWVTRAEMQERNGEYDAAFASWSVARGLGIRELDEELKGTYVGIAQWEVAANNLGGSPPAEAAAAAPKPGTSSGGSSGTVATRPRNERPATAPRLGEAMPGFSVDTGYGTLSNTSLKGRIVVMTFWDSDCKECLQMLPAFGALARGLRGEGHDTVVVGVSMDDDPADFERVFQQGQRWAELVHQPSLGERFGVNRRPTTWVVDRAGVARYFVDHWLSAEELETYIRGVQ